MPISLVAMREEPLAFAEPAQRLARLAELRQDPGGGGDHVRKQERDVPGPERRDRVLDRRARLRPVALEMVERSGGVVRPADGVRMVRRLGEPDRLGFVLGRFGESPELGRGS